MRSYMRRRSARQGTSSRRRSKSRPVPTSQLGAKPIHAPSPNSIRGGAEPGARGATASPESNSELWVTTTGGHGTRTYVRFHPGDGDYLPWYRDLGRHQPVTPLRWGSRSNAGAGPQP